MKFLREYIDQFKTERATARRELGRKLEKTARAYDIFAGADPQRAFDIFVAKYNWLGDPPHKRQYRIDQNLARNLPGALMQDYLLHLVIKLCEDFPQLDVFTEVRVPFGRYPLWKAGRIDFKTPSEQSDLAVGYIVEDEEVKLSPDPWPRQPFYRIERNQSVRPLVTVNTKIRISQSEFFDWQGREQLMVKGNPHCLSVQVALRKEMDFDIVEAAQASGKFFMLGEGGETNVRPVHSELARLVQVFKNHLQARMTE